MALVLSTRGVLYGLTSGCVLNGYYPYAGTAFSLTPPATSDGAWSQTTIFNFTTSSQNIPQPSSLALIGGVLYGTSVWGGNSNQCFGGGCGLVFSLTPPVSTGSNLDRKFVV